MSEGGVESTQSATTALGHRDGKLLEIFRLTLKSVQFALVRDFRVPPLIANFNRHIL